jgi:hypothetical protein
MGRADVFAIVVVFAALVFQAWVTRKVHRSDAYEPAQKRAQTKLIWLVPVVGALVAFSMLDPEPAKADTAGDTRNQPKN